MSDIAPQTIAEFLNAVIDSNEVKLQGLINHNMDLLDATLDAAAAAQYNLPAGWNALTLAAKKGKIAVVRTLVTAYVNAKKNITAFKNSDGKTALDLAFEAEQRDTKLLDEEDSNNQTAADQIAALVFSAMTSEDMSNEELDFDKYLKLCIQYNTPSTAGRLLRSGAKYSYAEVISTIKQDCVAIAKMLVTGTVLEIDATNVQNIRETLRTVGPRIDVRNPVVDADDTTIYLMSLAARYASAEMLDMLYNTLTPDEKLEVTPANVMQLLEIVLRRRGTDGYPKTDNSAMSINIVRKMLPPLFALQALQTNDDLRPFTFLAVQGDAAGLIDFLATRGMAAEFSKGFKGDDSEQTQFPISYAAEQSALHALAALQRHGVALAALTPEQLQHTGYEFKFSHSVSNAEYELVSTRYIARGSLLDFAVLSKNPEFLTAVLPRLTEYLPKLLSKELVLLDPKTLVAQATGKNLLSFICSLPQADMHYIGMAQQLITAMKVAKILDTKSGHENLTAADYAVRANNTQILELLKAQRLQPTAFTRPVPIATAAGKSGRRASALSASSFSPLFGSWRSNSRGGATSPSEATSAGSPPLLSGSSTPPRAPDTPRRKSSSSMLSWMPSSCTGAGAVPEADGAASRAPDATTGRAARLEQ